MLPKELQILPIRAGMPCSWGHALSEGLRTGIRCIMEKWGVSALPGER